MIVGAAAGLVVVAATALSFVSMLSRLRFRGVEGSWKEYAEEKGMRFTPSSGWHRAASDKGRPPTIEAEVQGVQIDVTIQTNQGRPMTRVEAMLPSVTDDFLFAIYRRKSLGKIMSELSDVVETPTGNKVFDATFALLSNESDTARSILDRRLAQVVGDFPREFSYLYANQSRFTLIWPGMETETAILDAGINLVWTACRRRA